MAGNMFGNIWLRYLFGYHPVDKFPPCTQFMWKIFAIFIGLVHNSVDNVDNYSLLIVTLSPAPDGRTNHNIH